MTIQSEIDRLRAQRAAEWLEIMHGNNPGLHREFVQWITESPLNLDEFLKLDALSRETRATLQSADFDRGALLTQITPNVAEFKRSARIEHASHVVARRKWRWTASIAAGLVVAAVMGAWGYGEFWSWTSYATGKGEQRALELADGSLVYLNADSKLAIRLGRSAREVRLSRGEALFDVARDKSRPFAVQTQDAVVEAVGTQFNVNAGKDGTRVAVIEGKVQISGEKQRAASIPNAATTALVAGEAAYVTPVGKIERDVNARVSTAVAWNQPQLIFSGTALEEAVEQFNRHRRSKRLRLDGVIPKSHHYTGLFNATDSETFAALLARERDLEVDVREDEIVIRRRD